MGRAWIVISVLLCACGGGGGKATAGEPAPIENKQVEQTPVPPPQEETPMMVFKRFTRDMCACAPGAADCAKRVSDEMTAWSQKMASQDKEPVKFTEDEQKQLTEIGTRMGECMQRAMTQGP